jgi:hypothetical protein
VRGGRCVTVDLAAARASAREAAAGLFDRAGLAVPHRWPHVAPHDDHVRLPGEGRLT